MAHFQPDSASAQRDAARRHTHRAYGDRNELLAILARVFPSHLMPVQGNLAPLDERTVLCIHTPKGQLAWVLDRSEIEPFEGLERLSESHYDGARKTDRSDRIVELIDLLAQQPIFNTLPAFPGPTVSVVDPGTSTRAAGGRRRPQKAAAGRKTRKPPNARRSARKGRR